MIKACSQRRNFLSVFTGILSGVLLACPRPAAAGIEIKRMIWYLDSEHVAACKPMRSPDMVSRIRGAQTFLYRKGKDDPLFYLNRAGGIIWDNCSGRLTTRQIATIVWGEYQISQRQALCDCLSYVMLLNEKGAVVL